MLIIYGSLVNSDSNNILLGLILSWGDALAKCL